MKIRLSTAGQALQESSLYAFDSKVKTLRASEKDIILLGIGEPEDDTPKEIGESGIQAIKDGKTRYVPAAGSQDLRSLIAEKYQAKPGEVVVSHGAKTVLSVVLTMLIRPSDRVMMASPYYPPFYQVVKSLGGVPVLIKTEGSGFLLTAHAVEEAIRNNRPRILILNSPNNPTSAEYSQEELKKIAVLAEKHKITVIADECYSHFSADPDFSFRSLLPEAIAINTVSKTYAMPGWRIGWGVMPEELAKIVNIHLANFIGCPCSISERASVNALRGEGIPRYEKQREMIFAWLEEMEIPCEKFASGFYVFPNFSKFTSHGGSVELAEKILKGGVAVTPGTAFGDYDHYLRIAYCVSPTKLAEALRRMEKTLRDM